MKSTPMPALTIERTTLEQYHAELARKHAGKFALLKADKIAGIYDTRSEAEAAGYRKFGLDASFLVRQILGTQEKDHIFQLLNLDAYISNS